MSLLAALVGQPALGQHDETVRAIQATYLYKFGPFIEWPMAAFDGPGAPLRLCIVGHDPFGAMAEQAVAGQQIRQRPIEIRRMRTVEAGADCHILYAGGSEVQPVYAILDTVRGLPVLTVTSDAPPSVSGIVNFVVRDGRVRFEIDDQAAAENGLAISSKVLSLALRVRPRGS
ncbi:MAG: YfiR family protein [Alphaproteobacteria bacterium]